MSALFELNPRHAITLGLLVILALIPLYAAATGNTFVMTLFTRVLILAMAAVSLNLIMGYGGMVSFGHAAYLGLGGYAVGILAKEGIGSGFIQWPAAVAVSALFALVVGALSLRTRGVYFIMITLAFAQMVYYVAIGLDRYGGDDGLTIHKRSQFGGLIDLNNKTVFYYLCFALLLASIYLVSRTVNSRFGLAIQGARSNERRMRAIGFPVFRYKLVCFVIAGALCGLAGALLANHTNFISPAMMFWTRSGDLMVMVVLGGLATPFGPLIGTVTYLLLEEALSRVTEYPGLFLGPTLLLVAIFLHGGIAGLFEKARAVSEPLLQIEGLTKRFGGVIASDAITLDIPRGEFHAIIGPNGAGKTTLIGLLAGEIAHNGAIRFDGGDITALSADRRSHLGLARSFQITSLFRDFTALDNVALAVQAHLGHSFRFWNDARRDESLRAPAQAALERVGLGARAAMRVDRLSHGEQRQLEIAMALATRPRLLLLDEPMAGMGPDESARMVAMLRELKGAITILLIEHDMETVFALADRITVLVYGRVIASGDPAAIRADAAVREAYLGEQEATHG